MVDPKMLRIGPYKGQVSSVVYLDSGRERPVGTIRTGQQRSGRYVARVFALDSSAGEGVWRDLPGDFGTENEAKNAIAGALDPLVYSLPGKR